ncbi:MAG: UDP-N-acetylenolpyruvoylglucosamine reductase, partial [Oscillospiraceae bacterium]|nr:UDP-N-acetylenolpyruvoylglucosamine reductase [Oscillospiraceae bacterium]
VLSVTLKLEKGDRDAIKARMNELMVKRSSSQPLNMPSAVSTFKRPVGGYAAALIDSAGLKGYTAGGAQVSEKHAGFVINRGGASFDDVITVMEHIKKTVYETSGIELEPEVKIIRG